MKHPQPTAWNRCLHFSAERDLAGSLGNVVVTREASAWRIKRTSTNKILCQLSYVASLYAYCALMII